MNYLKISMFTALFAAMCGVTALNAQAVVSNPSSEADQDGPSAVASSPSTDAAQDGSSSVSSNPSGDAAQDGSATVTSNPSSESDQDGPAAVVSNPSSDADQDGPVDTGSGDNGNTDGGSTNNGNTSGSSRRSSGRGSRIVATAAPAGTSNCPLISSYMKLGGDNDGAEVAKLQAFLKNNEGLDVSVTGVFDEKTDAAVRAFQGKYLETVMGPWDATRPSGFVYITTTKKVNQLACNQPLVLTDAELSIINSYLAQAASADALGAGDEEGTDEIGVTIPGTLASATTSNGLTASAADASIWVRFWRFIVSLFR